MMADSTIPGEQVHRGQGAGSTHWEQIKVIITKRLNVDKGGQGNPNLRPKEDVQNRSGSNGGSRQIGKGVTHPKVQNGSMQGMDRGTNSAVVNLPQFQI